MITRHRYSPYIEQSHDGLWRVYKDQVKDSQLFSYKVKRRQIIYEPFKEVPGTHQTSAAAWQYADDLLSDEPTGTVLT